MISNGQNVIQTPNEYINMAEMYFNTTNKLPIIKKIENVETIDFQAFNNLPEVGARELINDVTTLQNPSEFLNYFVCCHADNSLLNSISDLFITKSDSIDPRLAFSIINTVLWFTYPRAPLDFAHFYTNLETGFILMDFLKDDQILLDSNILQSSYFRNMMNLIFKTGVDRPFNKAIISVYMQNLEFDLHNNILNTIQELDNIDDCYYDNIDSISDINFTFFNEQNYIEDQFLNYNQILNSIEEIMRKMGNEYEN